MWSQLASPTARIFENLNFYAQPCASRPNEPLFSILQVHTCCDYCCSTAITQVHDRCATRELYRHSMHFPLRWYLLVHTSAHPFLLYNFRYTDSSQHSTLPLVHTLEHHFPHVEFSQILMANLFPIYAQSIKRKQTEEDDDSWRTCQSFPTDMQKASTQDTSMYYIIPRS